MKHYLKNGELFAFELDGSQDHLIDASFTPATDDQVKAIQNPAPPALTVSQQLAKLDADNSLSQRNLRDFIMLTAKAMQELNPAMDLTQIPGVAKVVAVEAQAAALRAQM